MREADTSADADAALAAAESHLVAGRIDEARRDAAQAMFFLEP